MTYMILINEILMNKWMNSIFILWFDAQIKIKKGGNEKTSLNRHHSPIWWYWSEDLRSVLIDDDLSDDQWSTVSRPDSSQMCLLLEERIWWTHSSQSAWTMIWHIPELTWMNRFSSCSWKTVTAERQLAINNRVSVVWWDENTRPPHS